MTPSEKWCFPSIKKNAVYFVLYTVPKRMELETSSHPVMVLTGSGLELLLFFSHLLLSLRSVSLDAVKGDPGAHSTAGCGIPVVLRTTFVQCGFEDLQG